MSLWYGAYARGSNCDSGAFPFAPDSLSLSLSLYIYIYIYIYILRMAIFGHFTNRLTGNSSDRLTG